MNQTVINVFLSLIACLIFFKKQYLVVKAAGEKEARPVLRKMLEAVASVPVLAMLSKCGQERKKCDAKTSLQDLTLYTIIISK